VMQFCRSLSEVQMFAEYATNVCHLAHVLFFSLRH
jgi:hypothetical protein